MFFKKETVPVGLNVKCIRVPYTLPYKVCMLTFVSLHMQVNHSAPGRLLPDVSLSYLASFLNPCMTANLDKPSHASNKSLCTLLGGIRIRKLV